jgi:hypothetical protein
MTWAPWSTAQRIPAAMSTALPVPRTRCGGAFSTTRARTRHAGDAEHVVACARDRAGDVRPMPDFVLRAIVARRPVALEVGPRRRCSAGEVDHVLAGEQ